jgi:acyl-CoA synthetase (AMP-forming)/AMP-acid ligase II
LAIALPNTFEIIIIYFACAITGIIVVPLDSNYSVSQLINVIETMSPVAFIYYMSTDYDNYNKLMQKLLPQLKKCPIGSDGGDESMSAQFASLKHVILLDNKNNETIYKGAWNFNEITNRKLNSLINHEWPPIDPHDTFGIFLTVIFIIIK